MTRSVRLASAATVLAVALTLLALVAMQLVNIVARNVAMSRDVVAAHAAALAYHHRTEAAILSLPRTAPTEPGTSALSSLLASLLRR